MTPIGIMQVTDTLALGGLERVAVNLANCLPRGQYRSHICATRAEGPLKELIAPGVQKLFLGRTGRVDLDAARRLALYVQENEIQILHAHGTSLFISALATLFAPGARLVWHDHFGRSATEQRPAWIYRLAARRVSGVIAVNEVLADWSRRRLKVPHDYVWYVPNFVCEPKVDPTPATLPGKKGSRIVCVANLRAEKDHATLLEAMRLVAKKVPEAHLIMVGGANDLNIMASVQDAISREKLNASWLGARDDVGAILKQCDLGVLSSASEGLPLALIEYGMAGLAAVATNVGKCSEVLEEGKAGALVPPRDPVALGAAMIELLHSPERRERLGARFQQRVRAAYSANSILEKISQIYKRVLSRSNHRKWGQRFQFSW